MFVYIFTPKEFRCNKIVIQSVLPTLSKIFSVSPYPNVWLLRNFLASEKHVGSDLEALLSFYSTLIRKKNTTHAWKTAQAQQVYSFFITIPEMQYVCQKGQPRKYRNVYHFLWSKQCCNENDRFRILTIHFARIHVCLQEAPIAKTQTTPKC